MGKEIIMESTLNGQRWQVLEEDCRKQLVIMEDNSIDSVVTDPPYELAFMGKKWDKSGIAFSINLWREVLRVLKPGGHALVAGIGRTHHRTMVAMEDAGFELRDCIYHLFGSGFPKSLDISKAIDKAAGVEGKWQKRKEGKPRSGGNIIGQHVKTDGQYDYEALTPEAQQWDGWGTALKPAAEIWVLARKPCSEKTVAANVLKHGTGGINIDGGRIGTEERFNPPSSQTNQVYGDYSMVEDNGKTVKGRWPSNVVFSHHPDCVRLGTKKTTAISGGTKTALNNSKFGKGIEGHKAFNYSDSDGLETVESWHCHSDCPVGMLDRQSGMLTSGARNGGDSFKLGRFENQNGALGLKVGGPCESSKGMASRFFYIAKPSAWERDYGLRGVEKKDVNERNQYSGLPDLRMARLQKRYSRKNSHPTVKPIKLMEYLCLLITPPEGIILDPFCGSGTTGCAAVREGFRFIGIEQDAENVEIAKRRIFAWSKAPKNLELEFA